MEQSQFVANNGSSFPCVMTRKDAGFQCIVSFMTVSCPDNIWIVLNAFKWASGCISSYVIYRFDTKHKNLPASPNRQQIQTIQVNQWVLLFTHWQLSNFQRLDPTTKPKSKIKFSFYLNWNYDSAEMIPWYNPCWNMIGPNIKMKNCIHMLYTFLPCLMCLQTGRELNLDIQTYSNPPGYQSNLT